jgi:hypothetical protein
VEKETAESLASSLASFLNINNGDQFIDPKELMKIAL